MAESSVNRETTSCRGQSGEPQTTGGFKTCLNVNSVTLSQTRFHLTDSVLSMPIKYLEVANFLFCKEGAGHGAMEPKHSLEPESTASGKQTYFHLSPSELNTPVPSKGFITAVNVSPICFGKFN